MPQTDWLAADAMVNPGQHAVDQAVAKPIESGGDAVSSVCEEGESGRCDAVFGWQLER